MKRDYSLLLAKIILKFGTRKKFASEMGMSIGAFVNKISGKSCFDQKEIEKACNLLDIEHDEIPMYFFAWSV